MGKGVEVYIGNQLKEVVHTFQDSGGTCHILGNEVGDLKN